MEIISGIVGAQLVCGGCFGMGALTCRWVDYQKQVKRDKELPVRKFYKDSQKVWPPLITDRSPPPRSQMVPQPPPMQEWDSLRGWIK